jgi:hypothetical protein
MYSDFSVATTGRTVAATSAERIQSNQHRGAE